MQAAEILCLKVRCLVVRDLKTESGVVSRRAACWFESIKSGKTMFTASAIRPSSIVKVQAACALGA
jgi:hypothetical protein